MLVCLQYQLSNASLLSLYIAVGMRDFSKPINAMPCTCKQGCQAMFASLATFIVKKGVMLICALPCVCAAVRLSVQACWPCDLTVNGKGSSDNEDEEVAARKPRRFTEAGSANASR